MKSQDLAKFNLPDAPGVYFFYGPKKPASTRGDSSTRGGKLLYVGKATSLKDRVKSYFARDILLTRGPKIVNMLEEAERVEFIQTDSVLEALILEVNQIKRHHPPANSKEKDDRSYNFVVVTKEDFPRILIERGKNLATMEEKALQVFGPFPHSGELREALKIVRKIFPFRDEKCKITSKLKPCFNAQIGLCPGPCAGRISKTDYKRHIRNIILFFDGKKDKLTKTLESEMKKLAKEQKFEEADKVKHQLFALDHIQDMALIKRDLSEREVSLRIEAYDIAHISGTNVVGVMTVVEDGEPNKSQYRKFKIRLDKNNDVANLREILSRRLAHPEWRFPDVVVVDGGKAQINTAKKVLNESGLEMIRVVSVLKDERHRAKEILNLEDKSLERAVLLANAEAHRFAIGYHRKLRSKGFRI